MTNPYQHDAQSNLVEIIVNMQRMDTEPMNIGQAQAAYTAQLVIASIANTQAILAINETMTKISNQLATIIHNTTPKDTP